MTISSFRTKSSLKKRSVDQEKIEHGYAVSKRQKELKFIELYGKENLKDQELICKKALELTQRIQKERRQIQAEVAYLIQEENAVKKIAAKLDKDIQIRMEKKSACIDVFQRACHGMAEPVVINTQIDEQDNKSLRSIDDDYVNNLF